MIELLSGAAVTYTVPVGSSGKEIMTKSRTNKTDLKIERLRAKARIAVAAIGGFVAVLVALIYSVADHL
jgi:hypothetical protein